MEQNTSQLRTIFTLTILLVCISIPCFIYVSTIGYSIVNAIISPFVFIFNLLILISIIKSKQGNRLVLEALFKWSLFILIALYYLGGFVSLQKQLTYISTNGFVLSLIPYLILLASVILAAVIIDKLDKYKQAIAESNSNLKEFSYLKEQDSNTTKFSYLSESNEDIHQTEHKTTSKTKHFCPNCEKPIDSDAKFCKYCGHQLNSK